MYLLFRYFLSLNSWFEVCNLGGSNVQVVPSSLAWHHKKKKVLNCVRRFTDTYISNSNFPITQNDLNMNCTTFILTGSYVHYVFGAHMFFSRRNDSLRLASVPHVRIVTAPVRLPRSWRDVAHHDHQQPHHLLCRPILVPSVGWDHRVCRTCTTRPRVRRVSQDSRQPRTGTIGKLFW